MMRKVATHLSRNFNKVEIFYGYGRYEIHVNGEFYSTAESMREAEDEIEEM